MASRIFKDLSQLRFPILFFVTFFCLFGALELVLRRSGYLGPAQRYLQGLNSPQFFLLQDEYFIVHPQLAHFFHPIRVPKQKDPQEFRVLSIGDSVTWGDGQENGKEIKNFSTRLQEMALQRRWKKKLKVFNLGAKSFSSLRIEHVVDQARAMSPDLVILQFGNSEFLELNTTKQLVKRPLRVLGLIQDILAKYFGLKASANIFEKRNKEGRAIFLSDKDIYTKEEVLRGQNQFNLRIERIKNDLTESSIPVIWLVPAGNAFYPPFSARYAQQDEKQQAAGQWFAQAQAFLQKGQDDSAREALEMAMELDGFPLRILKEMRSMIFGLSNPTEHIWSLDLNQIFFPQKISSLDPKKYYVDHCHFTNFGHQLVAEEILWIMEEHRQQLRL